MAAPSPNGRRSFPIGRLLLAVALVALAIRTVDVLLVVFLAVILAIYLDAVCRICCSAGWGCPGRSGSRSALAATLGALVGRGAAHRARR